MDVTVIVAIITAVQVVAVAVIGGLFSYFTKKSESKAEAYRQADLKYRDEREERERMREELNACMYDLTFAVSGGVEVLLHQAHGEKMNGNVDDALKSIKEAKGECNHLLNKNAAKI